MPTAQEYEKQIQKVQLELMKLATDLEAMTVDRNQWRERVAAQIKAREGDHVRMAQGVERAADIDRKLVEAQKEITRLQKFEKICQDARQSIQSINDKLGPDLDAALQKIRAAQQTFRSLAALTLG